METMGARLLREMKEALKERRTAERQQQLAWQTCARLWLNDAEATLRRFAAQGLRCTDVALADLERWGAARPRAPGTLDEIALRASYQLPPSAKRKLLAAVLPEYGLWLDPILDTGPAVRIAWDPAPASARPPPSPRKRGRSRARTG